jgi:long-chain acyl-CoA synthetase
MEKIWYKSYDPGIPHFIDPDQYDSLIQIIEESFSFFSQKIAFSSFGECLTYQDIEALSRAFAGFLQKKCQLEKGDRVVIMLPNILQFPVAMFGTLRAGMIPVNVNPLYTPRELKLILDDSGAKCIVAFANIAHTVQAALPNTDVTHVVVTEMGDLFSPLKGMFYNFVIKKIKKLVPDWYIPNVIPFKDTITPSYENAFKKPTISSNDIAFLEYTGGTTGNVKGTMLTHRNMIANILQIYAWSGNFFKQEKENVVVNALPMYHIFSLTANCLMFFKVGFHDVLVANPRDVPTFIKELKRFRFSVFFGVNTLFNLLLQHPEFSKLDFSALRLCIGGGMAVQGSVANKWKKVTGVSLLEGYGLTETSPVVTVNPVSQTVFSASVGLPLPSTDVKICDENGYERPIGEIGELWIRGPQVMKGYWNNPEKTKSVLSEDGWFRTGDLSKMDDRGYVYLVDRLNDLIIVSGFNVYPTEVEEVISSIEGVFEVAVIGKKSEEHGEIVKAYIVKSDPSLTAEKIIDECHISLTNYKVPHEIEFRTTLPKSNVGKILRRVLREEAEKAVIVSKDTN